MNGSNRKIRLGYINNRIPDIYDFLSKTCKKSHNAKGDIRKPLKLKYFV